MWRKIGWKACLERQFGAALTSESAELPSRQLKLPNLPSKSTFVITSPPTPPVAPPLLDLYNMHNIRILTDAQQGFRRRRSCESQLLLCIDDIVKSLDMGDQIDIILLDLKKAIDKVPYQRLLQKLVFCGIKGQLNEWVHSFLSDRTLAVVLE